MHNAMLAQQQFFVIRSHSESNIQLYAEFVIRHTKFFERITQIA